MTGKMTYSESFIKALDDLKTDTNRSLIYSMHIVSSEQLEFSKREFFANKLSELSIELRNIIQKLDVSSINSFNLREREQSFRDSSIHLHKAFSDLFSLVDKRYSLSIDPNALFSISETISQLKDSTYKSNYLITLDKIDNLLAIKRLIINIYERQFGVETNSEKTLNKNFYDLKEKTYLNILRGINKNPVYLFKATELLKRFIGQDIKSHLTVEEATREYNIIEFWGNDVSRLTCYYAFDGIILNIVLSKKLANSVIAYSICGFVEKGTAKVDFVVNESILVESEIVFERVSGIDIIISQYEKLMLEDRIRQKGANEKNESLNKSIVNEAIDSILFT